jgi:hypothetical protein
MMKTMTKMMMKRQQPKVHCFNVYLNKTRTHSFLLD